MEESKDYSRWHIVKTFVNKRLVRPEFNEREIWFCALGSNIGSEQDGQGENYLRPALVIRRFNNKSCLIVPLTKNQNKKGVHYFSFEYKNGVQSNAILSQIRLIDTKRLNYKSGYVSEKDFIDLKEKLKRLIA